MGVANVDANTLNTDEDDEQDEFSSGDVNGKNKPCIFLIAMLLCVKLY